MQSAVVDAGRVAAAEISASGSGHEPNNGVTTLEMPMAELPTGKALTVAVRPLTSLGTVGKPIAATFKT